jgi:hypothetical protein
VLAAVEQANPAVRKGQVADNTEHTHRILLQAGAALRDLGSVEPVVAAVRGKNCRCLLFDTVLWKPNVCRACDRHCDGGLERLPCLAVLERAESGTRHHGCNFLVVSSGDKEQLGEQERLLVLLNGKINTSRLNYIYPFPNGGMESQPWTVLFESSPEQPVRARAFEVPEGGKRGVARKVPNALEEEEEGGNADFGPTNGQILLG